MTFRYSNDKQENKFISNPIKKDKSFFCSLGDSFMLKNEYRKAIKEYLVSLMIDKSNIRAYKGASKAYKNLKEYDKAIKHLKNARNIYCFDSEIYYELGLNYLLNSDNKLALTHELSGEREMAILVYNTIIEKYPTYIPAIYSLAGLYLEQEKYKKSIVLYKKILTINSEYYRAYLGLGLCFDRLKKYILAVRFYKKYISQKPNSDTAKSLVGRIYEIYKNKESNTNSKLKIVTK